MKHFIEQLLSASFGAYLTINEHRIVRNRVKVTKQRAIITLMQLVSFMAILLLAVSAIAQESQPKFRFEQPSDEMDFSLPPVPSIPGAGGNTTDNSGSERDLYGFDTPLPPPPGANPSQENAPVIDQFFSTTTIIAPEQQQKQTQQTGLSVDKTFDEPVIETKKKKYRPRYKSAFKRYKKPSHKFSSVTLPTTIYNKDYSKENKHLPLSYNIEDQQKAFEEAVIRNDIDHMRSLYRNDADVHEVTEEGVPYVVLAAQHHNLDALRWLLMFQADANQADTHGLTALHYAARNGNYGMIELLLTYGADRTIVDNQGYTAIEYASNTMADEVKDLLIF